MESGETGPLLLGVDIGTYSSKGVLATPNGTIVAQHVIEHELEIPRPGWAEHDPERVWWGEFIAITRALIVATGCTGQDISAVAVSAIGPCLLPVDRNDKPLRPGILYGIDTRATAEIADLEARYGKQRLFESGGSILSSQTVGPKLLWLKRHERDVYEAAEYFHSASDYIVLRLTGEHVMDAYTASLYTPLFSFNFGSWSDEFAGEIVDLRRLPPVHYSADIAGYVTPVGANETGLKTGTPVAVGTVDAVAEALSVGAVHPGDLMCMYGTTAFFILATERRASNPTMWSVCHGLPGLYGVAAGMATTGAITRWFRDNLAKEFSVEGSGDAYAALIHEAEHAPIGSRGLILLPYFSGERTPINDPNARGVICGLTLAHDRGHLFRAVLEGTAYGIADNFRALADSSGSLNRVVAVGGGTRNPLWLQIVSDVSGIVQEIPAQTVGAAYGDAFIAGLASGIIPSLDRLDRDWVRIVSRIEPDPSAHNQYQPFYDLFHALRDHTLVDQHALAALQGAT